MQGRRTARAGHTNGGLGAGETVEAVVTSKQSSLESSGTLELKSPEAVRTVSLVRHYRLGRSIIPAVDGVSIAANRGEFIALLGASGSGKSTLLNLIAGLDRPDSGAIVVEGANLATMNSEQLAQYRRHTVGMVFQSFNLVPAMTLYENVELPMRFAEVKRRERRARAEEALARALVNRPKLLLADEPTGNLDSKTGTEIMELIRELNRTLEMTVIMVTHERPLAERYAHRMVFLGDGKLLGETESKMGAAR